MDFVGVYFDRGWDECGVYGADWVCGDDDAAFLSGDVWELASREYDFSALDGCELLADLRHFVAGADASGRLADWDYYGDFGGSFLFVCAFFGAELFVILGYGYS